MEFRRHPTRTIALAALVTAALAALPLPADGTQPENARPAFARAFRETVLAWDDGDPDFIQNTTTGQVGMQLAVWFQALSGANSGSGSVKSRIRPASPGGGGGGGGAPVGMPGSAGMLTEADPVTQRKTASRNWRLVRSLTSGAAAA